MMGVFNGERYLREAIESILAQTLTRFEFFIINDGSTDGSAAIIKSYRDPRIRVFDNPRNVGLPISLNQVLPLAKGRYIARMDCDDISEPERLEQQTRYLDQHPDCGVTGCAFQVIDTEGQPQYLVRYTGDDSFLRWYLCFQNPLAHAAIMMRREILQRLGGYDPFYEYAEDYDLWWRIISVSRIHSLPQALFRLRLHNNSQTRVNRPDQLWLTVKTREEWLPRMLGKSRADFRGALELKAWNTLATRPLLEELYRHRIAMNSSTESRNLIREDAAARLAIMFLRQPWKPASWAALFSALKLDKMVLPRMALWPVSRFIFKTVTNPILFKA